MLIDNYLKKKAERLNWIMENYFPLHIGHKQKIHDVKYKGGIFAEEHLNCSCLDTLVIDKDMIEDSCTAMP